MPTLPEFVATSPAYVTPSILRWARRRKRWSYADLSVAAHPVRIADLIDWEAGDSHPTWGEAERLARELDIPFGYLWLPTPPKNESGWRGRLTRLVGR